MPYLEVEKLVEGETPHSLYAYYVSKNVYARMVNDKCVRHIQTNEKPGYSDFVWNNRKVLLGNEAL